MKACTLCGITSDNFSPHKLAKDGLQTRCRPCFAARRAEWRRSNPDRAKAEFAEWRDKNPDYWRQYYATNTEAESQRKAADRMARREVYLARERAAQAADTGGMAARLAKRRARKKRATPAWADHSAIAALYRLAAVYSEMLGEPMHVDHVVPLQGKRVSGLHCEANLQILPKRANQAKGNRFSCA